MIDHTFLDTFHTGTFKCNAIDRISEFTPGFGSPVLCLCWCLLGVLLVNNLSKYFNFQIHVFFHTPYMRIPAPIPEAISQNVTDK